MNYKQTLNTDIVWVPAYCDLDEYLIAHTDGVRHAPIQASNPSKDSCTHLFWDSNFTMFHEQVTTIAALHGYLQMSTAYDLMQTICRSVTVTEICDSDEDLPLTDPRASEM